MADQNWKPKVAAFVCNWCTYAGADLAGTSRLEYDVNIRVVRLPCTGRIDPLFIIKAFERGADGVLVSGCHPGDCHYNTGNYHARRRWTVFRELLNFYGIGCEGIGEPMCKNCDVRTPHLCDELIGEKLEPARSENFMDDIKKKDISYYYP